jgi:hypothetical protein
MMLQVCSLALQIYKVSHLLTRVVLKQGSAVVVGGWLLVGILLPDGIGMTLAAFTVFSGAGWKTLLTLCPATALKSRLEFFH